MLRCLELAGGCGLGDDKAIAIHLYILPDHQLREFLLILRTHEFHATDRKGKNRFRRAPTT